MDYERYTLKFDSDRVPPHLLLAMAAVKGSGDIEAMSGIMAGLLSCLVYDIKEKVFVDDLITVKSYLIEKVERDGAHAVATEVLEQLQDHEQNN